MTGLSATSAPIAGAAETVEQAGAGTTVNLSLISHTNVGKTTLARTLLGRDVGEVRDAAHVTEIAAGYVLEQADDDTLMLWDTPGFGDTARLLGRLRHAGNPIGWFLTQVWDRWRERALWSSQQAVRNARARADVVLYLVNAVEDPAAATYIAQEMEVLQWIGKPVILLLNQLGPPRAEGDDDAARWRQQLAGYTVVAGALPMDAFARCWVQEGVLLDAVAPLLPAEKRPAMARLSAAWRADNVARFDAAMQLLAAPLAAALQDREALPKDAWQDRLLGSLTGGRGERPEVRAAIARLGERLETGVRQSTDGLIALHDLSGRATRQVLERLIRDYARDERTPEGASAMLGGLVSGALGGLAADLAAGGLTLGGGMIVGGVLGALGAGGIARGINLARGDDGATVRWSDDFIAQFYGEALLRYLAVAHFGRGRGNWEEGEHPPHWIAMVRAVVERRRAEIDMLRTTARKADEDALTRDLAQSLRASAGELLTTLYPDAAVTRDLRQTAPPPP